MIITTVARPKMPVEQVRALIEPSPNGRADDLPVMTVEDLDLRLSAIEQNGVPTGFKAMLARVGIRVDPTRVAVRVIVAAFRAVRDHRARTEWREPALADVRAQLALLDRAAGVLAAIADAQEGRGRKASAIAQLLVPHETSQPVAVSDMLRQIDRDRDRLLNEAAALDGRCRPTTRARLLIDAISPLYAELTEGRYAHRTGLTDFVRHSCLLVTGTTPSETLLRSVVTKRTK